MHSRIALLLASSLLATALLAAPAWAAKPNDTLYPQQWWLGSYSATASAGVPDLPTAWDRSTGVPTSGAGPVVAVLDSGTAKLDPSLGFATNQHHPDLDTHLLAGYDFVSNVDYANDGDGRDADASDPGDLLTAADKAANLALWDGCPVGTQNSWHGTLMAGQVGALSNNAAGVAGVNWNARVLPVRVAGRCGALASDVIDGMRWAAGLAVTGVPANPNPARIVVLGISGAGSCNVADADAGVAATARAYVAAIAELRAAGVLVVAPAGNERSAVGRPANCAGVFAVASLNRQGMKALYSNYGSEVALATVGGDDNQGRTCDSLLADTGILSTSNTGLAAPGNFGYASASGSSFAVPVVAATASLMLAVNPALTLAQVEAGLKASARPHVGVPALGTCSATGNFSRCACTTSTCGAGILDAPQALAYAAAPASYVAPARSAVVLSSTAIDQCAAAMGLTTTAPTNPTSPTNPASPSNPSTSTGSSGGGGGGAMDLRWLALLGLSIAAVRRVQRAG